MNAISLNNLWNYLQGLSLTESNLRWLASHLMEAAESVEKKQHKAELVFPKIPKDYKPSTKVMGKRQILNHTIMKMPSSICLHFTIIQIW